jgi:3-methyladenine DNA glycosylase AlkD
MASSKELLKILCSKANTKSVEGMAKFGMTSTNRLGISVPDMRKISKENGKDHEVATELWDTGIPEAQIVAALIAEPEILTEEQMEHWVKDINSWDVCDQVCLNLFDKSSLAWKKIYDWSEREEEFVKRTAFSLIACIAWHDKTLADEKLIELFPLIKRESTDERNFVKKAVNWALRHIGKKNKNLNNAAITLAKEIKQIDSKSARWIANDAIRELESEKVQLRLKGKQ